MGRNWKFLCKCGDGSAFFEHKVTGELMNWNIKPAMDCSGLLYFNIPFPKWRWY